LFPPGEALADLVDPRFGIVSSCVRAAKDWREPPRPILFQATLANFDFRKVPATERMASGKGATKLDSWRGAVVEALERYCALQRRPDAVLSGPAGGLDAPAIAPEELVLYSDRQYGLPGFRYRRPPADGSISWVLGSRVDSADPVYVPASLVYMNFMGVGGTEFFTHTNTSGLAGGINLESAMLAGLYELVERDAYMVTWLARLPVPQIEFADNSRIATEIRNHYERFGIETLTFDLTTDVGIPVVMAIAFDHTGALPAAAVGLGCDLDPGKALDRAVMEIVQVRSGLVPYFRRVPSPEPLRRHEEVRSLEDHAAFAGNPDNRHEFDFLVRGKKRVALPDLPDRKNGSVKENLRFCCERLEAVGASVAFVDLTMPDLDRFPVRIVRAIASGLQPIHFGFGEERLGGRRPFAVPRLLGYASRDLTESDLNPCPHPVA
jgi:ribosomal protein S12 methylthiotransferase accessory factor